MQESDVLKILKDVGAVLEGHFELRSGLHSDRYFQCARVLERPDKAGELCAALAARLRAGFPGGLAVDGVIAPALGGILVGYEIARALGVRSIFTEKEFVSAGAPTRLELRRFSIGRGERLVVAEDVVTRGGRVQETLDIVGKAGGIAAAVVALVDRSGGRAKFTCPMFSLLRMEPVAFEPGNCPLCARGVPVGHPGS